LELQESRKWKMVNFVSGAIDWLRGSPEAMRREEAMRSEQTALEVSARFARGNVNLQRPDHRPITREEIDERLKEGQKFIDGHKKFMAKLAKKEAKSR